jgi:chitosanase
MNPELIPFDPELVSFIRRILSTAETGKPQWDPSAVYVYKDDNRFKPPRQQITLSIGFTEGGGNLKKVLERYTDKGGVLAEDFAPYLATMGRDATLANDVRFKNLLREAGTEPAMKEAQEECFDELYLEPAFEWAGKYGFTLPLSYLVITDSFLHSGSMLPSLMNAFPEKKPVAGGDEKTWINEYLNARKNWLENHSNKILNNTVYRVNCYLIELAKGNWDLNSGSLVMNGTQVTRIA